MKLDEGLLLEGEISTAVRLECHRCLTSYDSEVKTLVRAEFKAQPDEESWPITDEGMIDLAPAIRQEILVALPLSQVCEPDCPGLCPVCGERTYETHAHAKTAAKTLGQLIKRKDKNGSSKETNQ
jgi:uncharacterized protein